MIRWGWVCGRDGSRRVARCYTPPPRDPPPFTGGTVCTPPEGLKALRDPPLLHRAPPVPRGPSAGGDPDPQVSPLCSLLAKLELDVTEGDLTEGLKACATATIQSEVEADRSGRLEAFLRLHGWTGAAFQTEGQWLSLPQRLQEQICQDAADTSVTPPPPRARVPAPWGGGGGPCVQTPPLPSPPPPLQRWMGGQQRS